MDFFKWLAIVIAVPNYPLRLNPNPRSFHNISIDLKSEFG